MSSKKPAKNAKSRSAGPDPGSLTAEDWGEIDMTFFDAPRSPAPAFPLEALPERLRSTITGIAQSRRVNLDFLAASAIAIASGAVGNRARLAITPTKTEPGALFLALVGDPGDGKTDALDVARQCFNTIEAGAPAGAPVPGNQDPIRQAVERSRNITARRTLAAEDVSPVPGGLHQQTSHRRRQFLLGEATTAGIRDALAASPEGRVFLSDELLTVMNPASGHDHLRTRALLLEAFDGKPKVFRNANGETSVEAMQFCIIGATQPDRVPAILTDANDGMASRFLWCAPDVRRHDDLAVDDGPMPDLVAALARLANIEPRGLPGAFPALVGITDDARVLISQATHRWNEKTQLATAMQKSLLARARSQALRLSFVIALAERALAGAPLPGAEIGASDIERGIALMDSYFLIMGERVTTEMTRRHSEPVAAQLARFLARLRRTIINPREHIRRGVGSPVRQVSEINEALEELRLRGFIKEAPRQNSGSGRPTSDWRVNPKLFKLR